MPPYAEVIGDPIAHSKSPAVHGFWLEALGIKADYRACRVRGRDLGDYLTTRRNDPAWRGCNLTAPLKERALPLVDELTARAERIGAINLIRCDRGRLIGDNSDTDGIAEALPGSRIAGISAIVIGAGGAARAAVDHLVGCGAREIHVLARDPPRGSSLRSLCRRKCTIEIGSLHDMTSFADAQVAINASPLGMSRAPVPVDLLAAIGTMSAGALVFDMVYEPLETDFLKAARRKGLTRIDGLTMLIGQARRAFELFFDAAPPRNRDAALRARLTGVPREICLVLVGLPGVGKTTIGSALADRLGLKFFDSDQQIKRLSGMSIPEFFERHGEQAFRDVERGVVAQLIEADGRVVALGGGAFADPRTRQWVKQRATSIWLDAELDAIRSRLKDGPQRPLLRAGESALQELSQARWPSYAEADVKIAAGDIGETLDAAEHAVRARIANPIASLGGA